MGDAISAIEEGFYKGLSEATSELVEQQNDLFERLGYDAMIDIGRQAARLALAPLLWENRLGPTMSTSTVCEELAVTRQAVAKAVKAGRLLAIPAGKTRSFPIWQFRLTPWVEARAQSVPRAKAREEVGEILAAFRDAYGDVKAIQVASWAMTPQPELERSTPAKWLEDERPIDPLLLAAQRAAAALAQ